MARICFVGEICISGGPGVPPGWPPPGSGSSGGSGSGNPPPPTYPYPVGPPYKWHPLQPIEDFEEIGVYPDFLTDVTTLEAIHHATVNIADNVMREAVQRGIEAALTTLRKRTAKKVKSIEFSK